MAKTVRLESRTYERLKARGRKGDTFDDIINAVLNQVEK